MARHLLGVAHARVEPIAQHGAHEPQAEAGGQAQDDELWRRIPEGLLRGHGRVENPHVRDAARLGKSRFVVALLHARVEVRGQVDIPPPARFLDCPLRNPPQIPVCRGDLRGKYALARRQFVYERLRQRRNGAPLQQLDLSDQPLDGGVIVGVLGGERAPLGLLRGQFSQRLAHIRRALHGADEGEPVGGPT